MNVNRNILRKDTIDIGMFTNKSTSLEMIKHRGSWTYDHCTDPNNMTYTTTTFHYI